VTAPLDIARQDRAAGFQRLRVRRIDPLTDDAVAIEFDVPEEQRPAFDFRAGQHLVLRCVVDGREERRTYSLCSPAGGGVLQVAVKRLPHGAVSTWLTEELRVGDEVDVLPPTGSFGPRTAAGDARTYGLIAAGSGITPLLSIAATVLAVEDGSEVVLVYGNSTSATVMFLEALADLKDRHPDRLHVVHLLSREAQESALLNGRIDRERLGRLFTTLVPVRKVDEWYLCGPREVIASAQQALTDAGVAAGSVHRELFYAGPAVRPVAPVASAGEASTVTVSLSGRTTVLRMLRKGPSVLEALLEIRPDAPYACRSGVCGTCRARCLEGSVGMGTNFALEPTEVEAGVVLTCQARPISASVRLEFH
jgi:ring-1,2-phenylacetyl-CoA epoxidase subunit PaaE